MYIPRFTTFLFNEILTSIEREVQIPLKKKKNSIIDPKVFVPKEINEGMGIAFSPLIKEKCLFFFFLKWNSLFKSNAERAPYLMV